MFGSIGFTEIALVVGIGAVFFFGPQFVRAAGTSLGENIREAKKAMKGIVQAVKDDPKPEEPPKA